MNKYRLFILGWTVLVLVLTDASLSRAQSDGTRLKIRRDELWDKIYASWLGQMVGNIYGLPHENKYIDAPGPETFPYGYTRNLERLQKVNSAFSDDDTDIEYIYLLQMEKYGPEPTYLQLANAWKYHIRESVWLANRAALGAIHFGYTPPFTGAKELNPHWFQIDPQLVNEIWGVTAPGMVTYAAEKSAWAARITNDDWGIEPTIHYGAMFAAAYFESDVNKLIDRGLAALPAGCRFASTVQQVKLLHQKYPDQWQKARSELAEKYYVNEPAETKTIWNANLNAACGILALLYGQGDFQRTLDLSCAMGFDADNQAATMSGLLGLMGGTKAIPEKLLYPVQGWKEPFNNRYKNVSRHDMPDATITGMADKSLAQAQAIIVKEGGSVVTENGVEYFLINPGAVFQPALEISRGPEPLMEVGTIVTESIGVPPQAASKIVKGTLPAGITLSNNALTGTPVTPGVYTVMIEAVLNRQIAKAEISLLVRGKDLSADAAEILSNVTRTNTASRDSMWLSVSKELYAPDVSIIRDGVRRGKHSVFYSIDGTHHFKQDFYGYRWNSDKTIGMLSFSMGSMEENGGWFTSLSVEYLDDKGAWHRVKKLKLRPALLPGDQPYNKVHFGEYLLSFDPVRTRGVRIIGDAGASDHWYSRKTWFTSITELDVYEPVPGIEKIMNKDVHNGGNP